MLLHAHHLKPEQKALLRNVVGALAAILLAAALIGLMALLLVFPMASFALQVDAPVKKNNTSQGDPVQERANAPAPAALPLTKPVVENSALANEINRLKAVANRNNIGNASVRGRIPSPTAIANQTQSRSAAWSLGLLYLHGMGVTQDPGQAVFWFKQANQFGEPLAAAGLAWCAIDGCNTPPNPAAARPWIAQLRSLKPGRALYLEWLLESTLSPIQTNAAATADEMEKTRQARRQLLLNAAKLQDVHALIELGFESVAAERIKEAQGYFAAAAPYSSIAADNARLVVNRQSDQKALCQVSNAAELTASTLLTSAQALHRGDLCQVNYFEAIRLYNLAAAKGNLVAKRMLGLIYSRQNATGDINIAWMQQLANLNVSTLSPNLDRPSLPPMLRREATALADLIPPYLRRMAESNPS